MKFLNLVFGSAVVASCLGAVSARADLIAEPYVGYSFGNLNAHARGNILFPGGVDVSTSETEVSAGARLGYKFSPGLWLAVDPQFAFAGKSKANSDSSTSNYSRTQIYADLGYDFPIVRAYLGYGLMNEQKFDDGKYSGGTAYKIGLAFHLAQNVALNAEYRLNSPKDVSDKNGTTTAVSDTFDKFSDSLIMIGLSFPFGSSMR